MIRRRRRIQSPHQPADDTDQRFLIGPQLSLILIEGDRDQIDAGWDLVLSQAKGFSQESFQPVPDNGSAMFLGNTQADPRFLASVGSSENQQHSIRRLALQ